MDAEEFLKNGFKTFRVAAGMDVAGNPKFVRALRDKYGYDVWIALGANCTPSKESTRFFSEFREVRGQVAGVIVRF